jgi:hypothetical protein
MHLEQALETAGMLRDALAAEVERARAERHLLRRLDAAGLFARAAERNAFLAEVARHETDLATALAAAAKALDLPQVTLERLRLRAPGPGAALAGLLSDVRALAGALQEIDRLNLRLAGRALTCIRGYVDAVQPTPLAYDRRGARHAAPALALVSSKG